MKAMILAAGLGTRLRPYTLQRPKPMFPILGKPLLQIHIEQLLAAGFSAVNVNAHHLGDQIATFIDDFANVSLQDEDMILGTGGGLRLAAAEFSDTPFLVVNGDIFHTIDSRRVFAYHLASDCDVTMVLHDYPRFNNVLVGEDGFITDFKSGSDLPKNGRKMLAFTGIQVVNPEVFGQAPAAEFIDVIDLYRDLIAAGGKIGAYISSEHYWTDMGTPADYLALHGDILTGDPLINNGDIFGDIGRPYYISSSAQIGVNVEFADWVSIGANAVIKNDVKLTRTVVWDGAVLAAGSQFIDRIVR